MITVLLDDIVVVSNLKMHINCRQSNQHVHAISFRAQAA